MNSGKSKDHNGSRRELGSRDRKIIDAVVRLRVLTNDSVQHLFLSQAKANATIKVTSRLVKTGWLKTCELEGRRQYYVPGVKAVRTLGLPASRSRSLGPQALATQLTLLDFVSLTLPRLWVLTDKEINAVVPDATKQQRAMPLALESETDDGPVRLIRVELGGSPVHVAKKLETDIRIRSTHPYFAGLIVRRRLIMVVLTSTETKKSLIEAAVANRKWPKGIRFNVTVVRVQTRPTASSWGTCCY